MLSGDKNNFAIECEIKEQSKDWILGNFRFWLLGEPIGDWEDSTDLKGCVNGLFEFIDDDIDRYDSTFENFTKEELIKVVGESPLVSSGSEPEKFTKHYDEYYRRFHIGHLGMSSFDNILIILLETESGKQRFVWKSFGQDSSVHESFVDREYMRNSIKKFISMFIDETNYTPQKAF